MFNSIHRLKKYFTPDTIFDIGAHHGNWTLSCYQIYPGSRYFMFEPIEYAELQRFKPHSQQFNVKNVILNDENKEVDWFEMRNTGDSIFREKTSHFSNCVPLKRQSYTLDSQISEEDYNRMNKVFLKIDCQGAEIPILKGAPKLLNKVDFILLEMPLFGQYNENVPTFLEHIQYMDRIGYNIFEIVEPHYVEGFMMQVDVLFIKKTHELNQIVQNKIM